MVADNQGPMAAEQAAELAAIQAEASEAPSPAPPGAEQGAAERIPTPELIRPVIALICVSVAPAWEVSEDEQGRLSEAYGAVLDKYFPDGLEFGPEITALIITAGVVVPRLGRPLKPAPKDEHAQVEGAAAA